MKVIDANAAGSGAGEGSGVRAATMTRFSCICVGRIHFFFLSNAIFGPVQQCEIIYNTDV
jgi:hypothetical protein